MRFRRGDGTDPHDPWADEELAAEIDVIERVRGQYPAGTHLNFGAPTRCPRCGDFGLVDEVDLIAGRSSHQCHGCGTDWTISVRAILAVDGHRSSSARGPRAWLAELARRHAATDDLGPVPDLEGVRFSRTADGEVVRHVVADATAPLPAPEVDADDGPAPWMAPVLPLRVLLIEDDPAHVETVRSLVEPAGRVDLRTATTRAAGEVAARVSQPDLVLLDLGLPDSTGEATLARWQEAGGSAPVLVVGGENAAAAIGEAGPQVAGVVDRADLAALLDRGDDGRKAFLDLLGSSSAGPDGARPAR
jgi:CheY-like chemotaxis protein